MAKSGNRTFGVLAAGTIAVVVAVLSLGGRDGGGARVAVAMPETLSPQARAGQRVFAQTCAACHGDRAQGTEQGPPLVHPFYHPGHHGDGAFHLAVTQGVQQHHWRFGDMPPQPGVDPRQTEAVIAYVRALQKANGILE